MVNSKSSTKTPLRLYREAAGKTQVEVAVAIGKTEKAYRDIENGNSVPNLSTAAEIAKVIQVPLRVICSSVGIETEGIPLDTE